MKYIIFTWLLLIVSSCGTQLKEADSSSQGTLTSDSQMTTSVQWSMGNSWSVRMR